MICLFTKISKSTNNQNLKSKAAKGQNHFGPKRVFSGLFEKNLEKTEIARTFKYLRIKPLQCIEPGAYLLEPVARPAPFDKIPRPCQTQIQKEKILLI